LAIVMSRSEQAEATNCHSVLDSPTVRRTKREAQHVNEGTDSRQSAFNIGNAMSFQFHPAVVKPDVSIAKFRAICGALPDVEIPFFCCGVLAGHVKVGAQH